MTTESFPDWADPQLSNDLPVLRERGENQDLEYMESFPGNVRELAKEIAAFATSNQGTILIGVGDTGDLIGLTDAETPAGRDQLLSRLQGICRGTIKPSITPTAKFAIEDQRTVLVILVPKGNQPVYYCNNVPYIRHITESRPAEPHEVVDLIRAWLPTADFDEENSDPYANLLTRLASTTIEVLVYAEEMEDRDINPWLDLWRAQFQQAANHLRELAVDDAAVEHGLSSDLNDLAASLEAVAQFRLYIGCAKEFDPLKRDALVKTQELKVKYADSTPLSDSSLAIARQTIVATARKLDSFVNRMVQMVEQGRIEDVQAEASELGYTLLRLSYYNVDELLQGLTERLRPIGRELHLVETMPLYMDGGMSMQAILDRIEKQQQALNQLTVELSQNGS